MKELININAELKSSLEKVITRNTFKEIIVGEDYIPVTGKKIDTTDILFGIDSTIDAWLTTGRSRTKTINVIVHINCLNASLLLLTNSIELIIK